MEGTPTRGTDSNPRNPKPSSSSLSPSPLRLWRPAAQRNLRNQWSKLLAGKNRWLAAASDGRSHATALVNSLLSQRYMPEMDLGALKEMPGIRERACQKLAYRQELCRNMLLSSYKDMVLSVSQMVRASGSMRCFVKKATIGSSIIQFYDRPDDTNDSGDCGGVPVFSSFSVLDFENLAQELAGMFVSELVLKRLLVMDLSSIKCKEETKETDTSRQLDEIFDGEFDELRHCGILSQDCGKEIFEFPKDLVPGLSFTEFSSCTATHEVLQVYLTTWIANVNINMSRIDEIFVIIEEEMQIKLL